MNKMNIEPIKSRCEAAIKNFTGKVEQVEIVGCGNGTIIVKTERQQFEFNHLTGSLKLHMWSFI